MHRSTPAQTLSPYYLKVIQNLSSGNQSEELQFPLQSAPGWGGCTSNNLKRLERKSLFHGQLWNAAFFIFTDFKLIKPFFDWKIFKVLEKSDKDRHWSGKQHQTEESTCDCCTCDTEAAFGIYSSIRKLCYFTVCGVFDFDSHWTVMFSGCCSTARLHRWMSQSVLILIQCPFRTPLVTNSHGRLAWLHASTWLWPPYVHMYMSHPAGRRGCRGDGSRQGREKTEVTMFRWLTVKVRADGWCYQCWAVK